MAQTINPAVGGISWRRDVIFYMTGVAAGFTVVVTLLAVLFRLGTSLLTPQVMLAVVLVIAGTAIARDLGIPVPLPYRRGQVPEWYRDVLPPAALATVFGFLLGTGFSTYFTFSVQTAAMVFGAYRQSGWAIGLLGLLYAAGRGLGLASAVGIRSPEQVVDRFRLSRAALAFLRLTSIAFSIALVVINARGGF